MDNLSSRLLNDAFLAVPEVLTHCFNLSFQQAKFPNRWKLAKIIPLFKRGDVCNYRPVPLLPLPGKLLEKGWLSTGALHNWHGDSIYR